MSENDDEQIGEEVTGVVTAFYPSEGENSPYNVYLAEEEGKFSTFDGETADPIEEGVKVRFRYVENSGYRNIVEDSVEVIDEDPSEVYGDTGSDDGFTPTDARIMAQSLIRSAVLHHQHRPESTDEDVAETAEKLAQVQGKLYRRLQSNGGGA